MAGPPKTKVSKRKLDTTELAKNPKASKQDHNTNELKALKLELNLMKDKYESLVIENKEKINQIDVLQKKINELEVNKNKAKSCKAASVQTENMDGMLCVECEYPAEDIYDLGEHMYEIHADANDVYIESCHYCTQYFKTKSDVMMHNKRSHIEKVKPCQNFLKGHCDYTDIECWFSHAQAADSVRKVFECHYCSEKFNFHSEFMTHKKKQHTESVPRCREEINCRFGEKCWFLHFNSENLNVYENGKNQDYLEKLFDMVEKFTNRIIQLENKINE